MTELTFEQRVRARANRIAKPSLKLISRWIGDKGQHTSKIKLIREDDFVNVWVNNGDERSCNIRLDDAMQQQIVEFLKNN